MLNTTRTKKKCNGTTVEWEPKWVHDEGGDIRDEYPWDILPACKGEPCTCIPYDENEPSEHFLSGDVMDLGGFGCTECDYNYLKALMGNLADNIFRESPVMKYLKGGK